MADAKYPADIAGNVSTNGSITATGNILTDATGSTTGSPRRFGVSNLPVNTAARMEFGGSENSVQAAAGTRLQIESYWGLELCGNRQGIAPSFVNGANGDPSVTVVGQAATRLPLAVKGAASQSANLQEWQDSGGIAKASVDPNGKFSTGYTDSSGTPGNATANTPSGRSAIAASASAVTITSSCCVATSVVLVQLEDLDTTAQRVKVVPGAGSFVVTANAAATAATKFRWFILN